MRHRVARMIGLGCLLAAAGCSTPEHSNTLIFATNTKIALDVSVNPAGGTPDITLGYKRQEGVFMPLLANQGAADARTPATCGANADCTFKSEDSNTDGMTDTYSVLASLGAEFSSGASGTGGSGPSAQASGGLAQFFATGIAAQKLAEQGGAALVSVQPSDQKLLEAMEERALRSERRLEAMLGSEKFAEATNTGADAGQARQAKEDKILNKIAPGGAFDLSAWQQLVESSTLSSNEKQTLKDIQEFEDIRNRLSIEADATIDALVSAAG